MIIMTMLREMKNARGKIRSRAQGLMMLLVILKIFGIYFLGIYFENLRPAYTPTPPPPRVGV